MKYLFVLFCVTVIAAPLYPQENSGSNSTSDEASEPLVQSNISMSIVPFTYWHFMTFGPRELTFEFDKTQSTTYESNFRVWHFSFGGSASVNKTVVGKIDNVLGYLGFSSFSVKVLQGHFRGTGRWSGDLAGDMKNEFTFDDTVRSYDFIYNGGENVLEGLKSWYAGVSYTTLHMPMEFSVEVKPPGARYQETGKSFYDEKFSLDSFGITFGFDMLKDQSRKPGLSVFGVSQDRFMLYNNYSISKTAVSRALLLNPGYRPIRTRGTDWFPLGSGYLDNESAVGLSYTQVFSQGWIIFAVGYDFIWGLIAGQSWESLNAGYMALSGEMNMFFRHGIIFRVYGAW